MRDVRLGDDIDDFCVRCKRVMNHNVVSVLDGKPAKVRCRTCHSDHDFRNEQPPPPKIDARKAALFNEVLKKVAPGDAAASVDEADLALVIDPDLEGVEAEADTELEAEGEVEAEAAAGAAPAEEEAPAPKRGRGRPKK
jgi:hypothetical protein